MAKKQGEGRGLEPFEVAVIKGMIAENFPRDYIMSFIVRPGRVISPAVVSDVDKGRIGKDIQALTPGELTSFISTRLNEVRPIQNLVNSGPLSPFRIKEILRITEDAQSSLPGFENVFSEYKVSIPTDQAARIKISKTCAAYSNTKGGYIFFGIDDSRRVVGLKDTDKIEQFLTDLSQCISEHFSPSIAWEPATVRIGEKRICVLYVYESAGKPVIATRDGAKLTKGTIFARYSGVSKPIEPADLMVLLGERDRKVTAAAQSTLWQP